MLRSRCRLLCLGLAICVAVVAARAAPAYAAPDEADVLREWNALRADPPGYARHLEAWLPRFRGLERVESTGGIQTREGPTAVREAIAALRAQAPIPALVVSAGVTLAARGHVSDLGPRGGRGHESADGSTLGKRLDRHGQWQGVAHEAISFGPATARDVILELLVDDGVPGRGHRKVLLSPQAGRVGIACGVHRDHGSMCVLDFASEYVEARPPGPAKPDPASLEPLDDSKPYAMPMARVSTGAPTPLDLEVVAEINALRTDPAAWAAKLEALLPLFTGSILRRPGRVAMDWSGAPGSVTKAIAMLKGMQPQPAARLSPGLCAGIRDYLRVRASHVVPFRDHYYAPITVARRYGAGQLSGTLGMEGEDTAFDIVATWVVQGRGPNRTLSSVEASQIGVACRPARERPVKCALIYGQGYRDYEAKDVELVTAAMSRLKAARTDPKGEADRWRKLLPRVKGETLQLPGGETALPGGREALQALIARLSKAKVLPPLEPLGELQARARDFVEELAPGRMPGEAGSWSMRDASRYGQPADAHDPDEIAIFAAGDADRVALRLLLARSATLLGSERVAFGLWCGRHATKGQVCVADVSEVWRAAGPELP